MTVPRSRPAISRPSRAGEEKGARLGAPLALAPSLDRARGHDVVGLAGQTPSRRTLVRHLAESSAFQGIGYARAAKLADRFGDELPRLLAGGDPQPFAEILGQSGAQLLVEAWREDLARNDIVVWLDEMGLDPRLAGKIVKLWGAEAASNLRANPYLLMALANWREVDDVARRLGTARDHKLRLVGAVEAVLYRALHQQDTWVSDQEVERGVTKLLGSQALAQRAVSIAHDIGAAVKCGAGWQPAGAAMMERYVARRLEAMLADDEIGDLIARRIGEDDVDRWLDNAKRALGVQLNSEQRSAVHLALRQRFGLVAGGAGVGKTTVLRAICDAAESFGRVVHLMALAGRAAVRMREATHRPASTIAAFLKGCDARTVALGPESLVIIDESSMLDLPTFYRLLRALPAGAGLLLVGDEAQLGPIGFGLTFHAFVEVAAIPCVRLTQIYRQSDASGIPAVAAAVRDGRLPSLRTEISGDHGVVFIPTSREPTADDIIAVVTSLGGFADNLRVLSPLRAGDVGVATLNARFHALVASRQPTSRPPPYIVGEPIIFGRNDYQRDLRNGSLGVVSLVEGATIVVDFDGVSHRFNLGGPSEDIALAYAVTVHKAQGSQFRTVVIPVTESRLMDRSLIYTAITRATERTILVGCKETLQKAVTVDGAAHRRLTGLRR